MKKIALFCIAFVLMLQSICVTAANTGEYKYQNFICSFNGTEIVIEGLLDSNIINLNVPSDIYGVPVNIGDYAFEKCPYLKSAVIEDGVKYMGKGVFYQCPTLETVTIADSVEKMGVRCFEGCTLLRAVKLPNTIVDDVDFLTNMESSVTLLNLDGTEYLPLREYTELMGGSVSWNEEERCVQVQFGTAQFLVSVGNSVVNANGFEIELPSEVVIINERTYVPIVRY